MTKQTKIILAVIGGILLLCIAACGLSILFLAPVTGMIFQNVSESVVEDPVKVQESAAEVAVFDLPPGYTNASSVDILGMKILVWNHQSENSVMMLLQMPLRAEINDQTLEQMQEAIRRRSDSDLRNLRTIEEREMTIRGQPARMIIMEGDDAESGERYHQLLVAFQGERGMALLMMMNPHSEQNLALYEDLVASIR